VEDFAEEVHELEITKAMNISDVKALLERATGVPIDEMRLFNEAHSDSQLEGTMSCQECGLIPADDDEDGAKKGKKSKKDVEAPVVTLKVAKTTGLLRHFMLKTKTGSGQA